MISPRFDRSAPIGECAMCNETRQLTHLRQLPEVERYARDLAQFMSGKGEKPAVLKEDVLIRCYGYGLKSLFCDSCYANLMAAGSPN